MKIHCLPIFLVGMMGAGKTTLGQHLANVSNSEFLDLDQEIENRLMIKISTLFKIQGEKEFRRQESLILQEYINKKNSIISTGGGIVLSSDNRSFLKKYGTVIYLKSNLDELFYRVKNDQNRPLLATVNPYQTLKELLNFRENFYTEVADLIIDTSKLSEKEAIQFLFSILKILGKFK
ncbi:MAG: shikimate kinase [Bordetella sp.]|nr:MAG: shikimate kinase [Bordetella sp.]